MSGALHLKYRPKKLGEVFGNAGAISAIKAILDREVENIPRAWLFTGPAGTGKTTLVRILRNELGCHEADYHEYNASNSRGIDTVREITSNCRLSPMGGPVKLYLLDEFHQMTGPAQEAMLKILEDSPKNTFFMLATTEPEKLKKSIISRCTHIKTSEMPTPVMMKMLNWILEGEEIDDYPKELLQAICKSAGGSAREAVKLLDTVIDVEDDDEALELIKQGTADASDVIDLCRLLAKGGKWPEVAKMLENIKGEPEQIRRAILTYFHKVALGATSPKIIGMRMECFEQSYFNTGMSGLVLSCIACTEIKDDIPF